MKNNKNGTLYAVAFSRNDEPSKLLNLPLFSTPAEAKLAVGKYKRDAKAAGHKNYGRTWDYMAVAVTPL